MRWWLVFLAACGGSSAVPDAIGVADAPASIDAKPAHVRAFVSGYGPDIAWFEIGSGGALAQAGSTAAFAAGPSFLAFTADHLYAVSENTSQVGAYALDASGLTYLNKASSGGNGPAHLSVDRAGHYVLVANYGDGAIAVLPITAAGVGAPQQTLTAGANAHQIVTDPSNHHVFVPCKGADYIAQYDFDPATGQLTPNAVPHLATAGGAGPRHLAWAPSGRFAYLVNENSSTLQALSYDAATGRLTSLQTISTRAVNATGTNTGAEVWVHPGGAFVYASNRGDDNIATFRIDAGSGMVSLTGHTASGGATPRDFTLDPAGAFMYVANQGSGNVVAFSIDPATGMPSPTGSTITATMPSFVGLTAIP